MKPYLFCIIILLCNNIWTYSKDVIIDNIRYDLAGNSAIVLGLNNPDEPNIQLMIPDTIVVDTQHYVVNKISYHAFRGCLNLKSVNISSQVRDIGWFAFADCKNLTTIVVDSNNMVYDSREQCNAIIRKADSCIIATCSTSFVPLGVAKIGKLAFAYTKCDTLILPESVYEINGHAFEHSEISVVILPRNLKYIGYYAFNFCYNLKGIYCFSSNLPIAECNIFADVCPFVLYVPLGSISKYVKNYQWSHIGNTSRIIYDENRFNSYIIEREFTKIKIRPIPSKYRWMAK